MRRIQSEGNAELYSGIAGKPLSPIYYAHAAHGNRGKQYAERREYKVRGMQYTE